MDIEKLANEADKEFSSGNILSLPKSKLIEYIQALSCINTTGADDRLKKSTQAQSLNTIYNVKVINELNRKNTILTWIVISLAIFTLALSVIQFFKGSGYKPEPARGTDVSDGMLIIAK